MPKDARCRLFRSVLREAQNRGGAHKHRTSPKGGDRNLSRDLLADAREEMAELGKLADPLPDRRSECPTCRQVLQPLSSGIPHYCEGDVPDADFYPVHGEDR
jgi:hypothetical protein